MRNIYCVIKVINHKKNIELYCFFNYIKESRYSFTDFYPVCFTGYSIDLILYLFSLHPFINLLSVQHALYIGKELLKAEMACFSQQLYIQE
uniref:DUF4346 domain-containing protein n=1 Tax=Thuretia quercifolia TaxID=189650 RepID=A0A1Z1MKW9_9FLOR|nr:hypothetical protein [Thuretia quercifolia]ARW66384.1 hypothetical protein [Thuretia quercifolia]